MTIVVKCGECGRQYKLKDAAAGKSFPCKECDIEVRVPRPQQRKKAPVKKKRRPPADPWDDDDEDDIVEKPRRRKAQQQKKNRPDKKKRPAADPWDEPDPWDEDDDDDDEFEQRPALKPRRGSSSTSTRSRNAGRSKKKRNKKNKKSSSKMPLMLGVGGGVGLLMLIGIMFMLFSGGSSGGSVDIDDLSSWKRVTMANHEVSVLFPDTPQTKKKHIEQDGGISHQIFAQLESEPEKGYLLELNFTPLPKKAKDADKHFRNQLVDLLQSLDEDAKFELKKKSKIYSGADVGVFIQYVTEGKQASVFAFPSSAGVVMAIFIEPVGSENESARTKFLESIFVEGNKYSLTPQAS